MSSTNLGSFIFFIFFCSPRGRLSLGKWPPSAQTRPCVLLPRNLFTRTLNVLKQQQQQPRARKLPFDFVFLYVKSPAPLFPPGRSPAAQSLWETLLTSKHKEAVMEVRRQLVEAASKEKLPIKMSMGEETQRVCYFFFNRHEES